MKTQSVMAGITVMAALLTGVYVQAAQQPTTLGWIERVAIPDTGLVMHAKIDTGADHSSINASDISYITHDGQPWVRFRIQDRNGMKTDSERPLLRVGHIERPVVNMALCVAGQQVNAEVNLADRDHFKYQLLVGRSLMSRRFLVDPDRTYITQPHCSAS